MLLPSTATRRVVKPKLVHVLEKEVSGIVVQVFTLEIVGSVINFEDKLVFTLSVYGVVE